MFPSSVDATSQETQCVRGPLENPYPMRNPNRFRIPQWSALCVVCCRSRYAASARRNTTYTRSSH